MTQLRGQALDAFKGMLISLIVLGHNYFFSSSYPHAFSFIYGFHVISFLLFPYLFLASSSRKTVLSVKLFRILIPQFSFVIIAGVVFVVVHLIFGDMALVTWLRGAGRALLTQRETPFREFFGMGLLWFLPALAVQSILLFYYLRASEHLKKIWVVVALLWHGCMGLFDSTLVYQMPFSFSLVSYLFVLGLAVHSINRRIVWNNWLSLSVVLVWLFCSWLAFEYRFFHLLAGDLPGPPVSIAAPVELLLQDGMILLSFFALLRLAYLLKSHMLAFVGRYSLQIFLIHPFVWQLMWRSGLKHVEAKSWLSELALTTLTFLATMLLTIMAARLIEKTRLQQLIFPRRLADWKTL